MSKKKRVQVTEEKFKLGKVLLENGLSQAKTADVMGMSVGVARRINRSKDYTAYKQSLRDDEKRWPVLTHETTQNNPVPEQPQGEYLGYKFLASQIKEQNDRISKLEEKVNGAWYDRVLGRK